MHFKLTSGLVFDFANMFGEGRLDEQSVGDFIDEKSVSVQAALDVMRMDGTAKAHLSKDGTPEHVYFLRMPYVKDNHPNTPDSIAKLEAFKEKCRGVDAVIFLGIGGSYLGAKTLFDALAGRNWNHDSKMRNGFPKIYFSGNNLDADDCGGVYEEIMRNAALQKQHKNVDYKVMLVPISKSGTTLETMASFLYFYEKLHQEQNIVLTGVVVTDLLADTEKAPLLQLARKLNWDAFDIKEGIGGRFCVMTDPGLLLLAALGRDIGEFLHGAREYDEYCQGVALKENPSFINAVLKYLAYEQGVDIEVFMPYNMALKSLSEWYVQLLAESLGKRYDRNGKVVYYGRTPIVAVGTTDMHAQTQQHQDGKRNKVVQFVEVVEAGHEALLNNPFADISLFDKYKGLDMHEALKVALDANAAALMSDKRYNARFVLPKVNEYYLGQLMYFLMLSIAYEGELANVDAFDQPGVEVYKKYIKQKLG